VILENHLHCIVGFLTATRSRRHSQVALGNERKREERGKRLLERRFGSLPAWAVERIQQADCEQLEIWSLRILEVGDLESIFV